MMDTAIQKEFFTAFKALGNDYWINPKWDKTYVSDIDTVNDLLELTKQETIEEYFIIGTDIPWLDNRLSKGRIPITILEAFKKLYPLYRIMRHTF